MDELEELHKQMEDLQKKANELVKRNKNSVIEEMKKKIERYGINASDLGFVEKSASMNKRSTAPVSIKYKKGDKTWAGRGRQPKFITDHIEGGGKIEELYVGKLHSLS